LAHFFCQLKENDTLGEDKKMQMTLRRRLRLESVLVQLLLVEQLEKAQALLPGLSSRARLSPSPRTPRPRK